MAYFAEIDENNIVKQVLAVDDSLEHRGAEFLANDLNLGGTWIQTSFNNKIRKQFASIGFIYDQKNDVFIRPQPYPSWLLDENFDWQAPKPKPEGNWYWDESQYDWVEPEGQSS